MTMEVYLGFITAYAFQWAPMGWNTCQGQLLSIPQNTALYSLLGIAFGGDGQNNFALPDLRGRTMMGQGTGQNPNLTPRSFAAKYGAETVALTQANLPAHAHTMTASNTAYSSLTQAPAANWTLGAPSALTTDRPPAVHAVQMYGGPNPTGPVQSAPSSSVGSGAGVAIMSPSLCLNFCIATQGLYPTRT